MKLKPPFPYYGNKMRAAPEIWKRFGEVSCYVEPFAGSLGCLLRRPDWKPGARLRETVNDADGHIINVWRAIKADPEAVWKSADHIVADVELTARHGQVINTREDLSERLRSDPNFYDPHLAGVWIWGVSASIGSDFTNSKATRSKTFTKWDGSAQGINARSLSDPLAFLRRLSERLRHARVLCGDWTRATTRPEIVADHGNRITGVLLDPPYGHDVRDAKLYAKESSTISADVRQWAVANASPRLRVALCGMKGEHRMSEGWTWWSWGGSNGQGRSANGGEGIWFSPDCLGNDIEKNSRSILDMMGSE